MSDLVLVSSPLDGVALLRLNRPSAMNALSRDLRREFVRALQRLKEDGKADVLIVTGEGRAFCAGLDLRELGHDTLGLQSLDDDDPVAALAAFPGPVIGAINGACVTGGFELALACDILVACDEARFADTHAFVGVMPGWGLSQKLSRLVGAARAKDLSFTGRFLGAHEAVDWGLVSEVVPASELLDRAIKIAAGMTAAVPGVLRRYKELIESGLRLPLGEALDLEARVAVDFNRTVSSSAIDSRRSGVVARGQDRVSQARK